MYFFIPFLQVLFKKVLFSEKKLYSSRCILQLSPRDAKSMPEVYQCPLAATH